MPRLSAIVIAALAIAIVFITIAFLENQTTLNNRIELLEERLATAKGPQASEIFPSDQKVIWYGQNFQSNRNFDTLEHLSSKGVWIDYRELPVNNLLDARVVVLSSVFFLHQFSNDEIAQLHGFVNSGGVLIIAVDTDFAFCEPPSTCGIDPVSRSFGFAFGSDVSDIVVPSASSRNHAIWKNPNTVASTDSLNDAYVAEILDADNVVVLGQLQRLGKPAIVLNNDPDFNSGKVIGLGLNTFLGHDGDYAMLENIVRYSLTE